MPENVGSDVLTLDQEARLRKLKAGEGWINQACPAACLGCNAHSCCWEFEAKDILEGRPCNCA